MIKTIGDYRSWIQLLFSTRYAPCIHHSIHTTSHRCCRHTCQTCPL